MSIRLMTRRCTHCRRQYPLNPSVGDFGRICPYCGRLQDTILPAGDGATGSVFQTIFKEKSGRKSGR